MLSLGIAPASPLLTSNSCAHTHSLSLQPHMPLFSIYSLALEQDQEQSMGLQQAYTTLHNQTFIQVHTHTHTHPGMHTHGISVLTQ